MKGQLWIVAAPSGGGKTSLIAEMVRTLDRVVESVSHTTRPQRPGEVNGVHYHFIDQAQFDALAQAGDFLEFAQVFHHAYATSGAQVDALLADGQDVILSIDWQGAAQVVEKRPDTKSIFLLPPSLDVLRERLMARGQDNTAVVEQRMAEASEQISQYYHFDYVIINDVFERAADEMRQVILAARCERHRCVAELAPLLRRLGVNHG